MTVVGKDGSVIPTLNDDGTVVEGPFPVALPMWRCWYNRQTWPQPHVEKPVKLRDGSYAQIDEIQIALREAPARGQCPGSSDTVRRMLP